MVNLDIGRIHDVTGFNICAIFFTFAACVFLIISGGGYIKFGSFEFSM